MGEWIRSGAWIPVLSFIAVVVSVVLFALAWGGRDAQEKAVKAWRELAEGYEATITELTKELNETKAEVHELRAELAAHQKSTKQAIDELIAGFARAGEK